MVRAILDGRKTQTRRIVKLPNTTQPDPLLHHIDAFGNAVFTDGSVVRGLAEVGTRLWVRESFWQSGFPANAAHPESGCNDPVWVWGEKVAFDLERTPMGWRKRPSIHMPRWASRITLEVTGVRVERLQDISEEDAIAEGVECWEERGYDDAQDFYRNYHTGGDLFTAKASYRTLWESINGPGSWERNDWVWVIEFKRIEP